MANSLNKLFERGDVLPYVYYSEFTKANPLWNPDAGYELNTYRNLNPIGLIVEPILKGNTQLPDLDFMPIKSPNIFQGRHSLFNAVNGVGDNTAYQVALNAPLIDTPETRKTIRQMSDCSIKTLVAESEAGHMGRAIYNYADFMFCKHLGRISNNYLITLRRFPYPAGDHINFTDWKLNEPNDHLPDIGRLVTWLGTPGNDMSGILKYDINLPYKKMTAKLQDASVNADNSGGFLGGLMNLSSDSYQNGMLAGRDGERSIGFIRDASQHLGAGKLTGWMTGPPDNSWAYRKDSNKCYGPVDSITETYYRQGAEDGGIKFEHNISITFDYELRSFDGINGRAAMLDLLANILAVCFTNAQYWGGGVRGTGAAQSNVFANLPIFHMDAPLTFNGMKDAVFGSIANVASSFNNGNQVKSLSDALNMMMNMAKGVFTGITAAALNALGRPQKSGLDSLINFSPTGLWHLMIGNPRHPILSMGNMILDNVTIEHYGPLGLDDFPTGLRVVVTLKHGMPRDNLKIEQMYMNGDWRIYQPLDRETYNQWLNADTINASESPAPTQTSTDAGNAIANETKSEKTTSEADQINEVQKRYFMKYFGTTEKTYITKAGMEGCLGDNSTSGSTPDTSGDNGNTGKKKAEQIKAAKAAKR